MRKKDIQVGQKVVIIDRNQVVLDNLNENSKRLKSIKGTIASLPYKVNDACWCVDMELEESKLIRSYPITRIELST